MREKNVPFSIKLKCFFCPVHSTHRSMTEPEQSNDVSDDSDEYLSEYGSYCSDYSNCSDRSIEITLNIKTTPFHLLKKEEGYSFITDCIYNIGEEIDNFKAGGEVITWWSFDVPSHTLKPLYIVKVWLKDWADTNIKRHLLARKEVKIIQKKCYWKLKYIHEIIPTMHVQRASNAVAN